MSERSVTVRLSADANLWLPYQDRWVNATQLLTEAASDPGCLAVQPVKVRGGVTLVHRAVQVLRGRVSKKRNDPGEFSHVVRRGLHGAPSVQGLLAPGTLRGGCDSKVRRDAGRASGVAPSPRPASPSEENAR